MNGAKGLPRSSWKAAISAPTVDSSGAMGRKDRSAGERVCGRRASNLPDFVAVCRGVRVAGRHKPQERGRPPRQALPQGHDGAQETVPPPSPLHARHGRGRLAARLRPQGRPAHAAQYRGGGGGGRQVGARQRAPQARSRSAIRQADAKAKMASDSPGELSWPAEGLTPLCKSAEKSVA